jgi:hypothetical protein
MKMHMVQTVSVSVAPVSESVRESMLVSRSAPVSISESTSETVTLVASVLAPLHPLVEILASKDPKFFTYSPKSQALILAQDINIQAMKIELASLKAQCEAAQVQCEAIRVKPNLIVASSSVLATTAVTVSAVQDRASSAMALKIKMAQTAPTVSIAPMVTMASTAPVPPLVPIASTAAMVQTVPMALTAPTIPRDTMARMAPTASSVKIASTPRV